jgi:hypothetical protein
VATVDRRVERLLHGAQQHGVDLRGIHPVLGGLGDGLELRGRGLLAQRQADAQRLQVVLQGQPLLGRGALVHTEQAGVLVHLMKSAAQTLAASMASSIRRCASLRTRGTIFSMRPFSSQTICVSVVSKSTAPRARAT